MTSTQGVQTARNQNRERARAPDQTRNNQNGEQCLGEASRKVDQKTVHRPECAGGASNNEDKPQQDQRVWDGKVEFHISTLDVQPCTLKLRRIGSDAHNTPTPFSQYR